VIDAEDLGVTLPHEHLLADFSVWFTEPKGAGLKRLAYEPVSIKNRDWIWHNPLSSLDNTRFLDEEMVMEEVMLFKREGGCTIVELSNVNIGRDPLGLARISRATGINVVMGSGYYVGEVQGPDYDRKTEEEIAEEIIADIQVGVGDTGVCAGIIGEIGISIPMREEERKVLRAAGIAQQETGAAINIHPGGCQDSPFECVKILDEVGVDLSRVAFSHMGRTFPISARGGRDRLAGKGCCLEFDAFGFAVTYPTQTAEMCPYDRPNDAIRITIIQELIEDALTF